MSMDTRIMRSFELVERMWLQVQDMGNALVAMTEAALGQGKFTNLRSAGSARTIYQQSASQWTYTACAISIPVMEKRRRKVEPNAWINYQISLQGSGLPYQRDSQETIGPVVHVSFWHEATDFDEPQMSIQFPPAWEDWEIKDERLLSWDSDTEGGLAQWTFSIRLLDLNDEDALRTCILEPVRALLAGDPTTTALPDGLPGLVFYTNDDQGEAGWTLLASDKASDSTTVLPPAAQRG
jgi:hypothetical protein